MKFSYEGVNSERFLPLEGNTSFKQANVKESTHYVETTNMVSVISVEVFTNWLTQLKAAGIDINLVKCREKASVIRSTTHTNFLKAQVQLLPKIESLPPMEQDLNKRTFITLPGKLSSKIIEDNGFDQILFVKKTNPPKELQDGCWEYQLKQDNWSAELIEGFAGVLVSLYKDSNAQPTATYKNKDSGKNGTLYSMASTIVKQVSGNKKPGIDYSQQINNAIELERKKLSAEILPAEETNIVQEKAPEQTSLESPEDNQRNPPPPPKGLSPSQKLLMLKEKLENANIDLQLVEKKMQQASANTNEIHNKKRLQEDVVNTIGAQLTEIDGKKALVENAKSAVEMSATRIIELETLLKQLNTIKIDEHNANETVSEAEVSLNEAQAARNTAKQTMDKSFGILDFFINIINSVYKSGLKTNKTILEECEITLAEAVQAVQRANQILTTVQTDINALTNGRTLDETIESTTKELELEKNCLEKNQNIISTTEGIPTDEEYQTLKAKFADKNNELEEINSSYTEAQKLKEVISKEHETARGLVNELQALLNEKTPQNEKIETSVSRPTPPPPPKRNSSNNNDTLPVVPNIGITAQPKETQIKFKEAISAHTLRKTTYRMQVMDTKPEKEVFDTLKANKERAIILHDNILYIADSNNKSITTLGKSDKNEKEYMSIVNYVRENNGHISTAEVTTSIEQLSKKTQVNSSAFNNKEAQQILARGKHMNKEDSSTDEDSDSNWESDDSYNP